MAKRSRAAADRQKHKELKGRAVQEGITNIKKGSSMPAATKKDKLLPFFVAAGVRMGHPNRGLTQHDPLSKRVAEEGDEVMLSKAQAEWCMANGFIDSILPDFEPAPADPDADSPAQEGAEPSTDGEGEQSVGGASEADAVSSEGAPSPRRKQSAL